MAPIGGFFRALENCCETWNPSDDEGVGSILHSASWIADPWEICDTFLVR